MSRIAIVFFLLAMVGLGAVAAPAVRAPVAPSKAGTMADPEVQALVAKMYAKVQEVMAAGQELVQENEELKRELSRTKAKLACT